MRLLTALFADVVGSTALGERLARDEVRTLIGECVSKMTIAVESYGGSVTAYMGDGIAAFFGLEATREDDPIRASLSALRIVDEIQAYSREIEGAWGIQSVSVRVGLNSGWVAAGLVGGANPQLVALGDAVNVASRLQGAAEPGSILAGATTAVRIGSRFDLERIGPLALRGRSETVEAWKVVTYKGEPEQAAVGPFVGRLHEAERFDRAIGDLHLGRGQIFVLRGEPGIGKSRLIGEFRGRSPGVLWLAGSCSPYRVRGPYGPFVDVVRCWLDIDSKAPEVLARIRLTSRLRDLFGSTAEEVIPYLGQLLSVELESNLAEEFDRRSPDDRANAIRGAYLRWLKRLAQDRPVAVVIDDGEQADASTSELLRELFRLTEVAPVLVILAMRSEPGTPGWDARVAALAEHAHRTVELSLEPLSDAEGDELVALLDPDGQLGPSARRSLCLRGEGNPLYLEELCEAARSAQLSTHQSQVPSFGLPPALEGLLLARVERVSARARAVLQVAAVCGRRFERELLEAASGEGVDGSVVQLVREALLMEDGRSPAQYLAFRHGLYQEAVLKTLPARKLQELHERVGGVLENTNAVDQSPEVVASHFVLSGNGRKAVEYLELAAERAGRLASLSEALETLDEARRLCNSLGDRAISWRLGRNAADLATRLGRKEEALSRWEELLRESSSGSQRANVMLEMARVDHHLGEGHLATDMCAEALKLGPDVETEAGLLLLLSRIALREGRWREATERLSEVEARFGALPKHLELERMILRAGHELSARGDFRAAESLAGKALAVAEESGGFGEVLTAKRLVGVIQVFLGRLSGARSVLEEVFEGAIASGHRVLAQQTVSNLACAHLLLGELERGASVGREAVQWLDAPEWKAPLLFNLGEIELERGDTAYGERALRECMRIASKGGDSLVWRGLALTSLAGLELSRGEPGESRARAEEALMLSQRFEGRLDVRLKAMEKLAQASLRQGEEREALEFARVAVAVSERCDLSEAPAAWRVLGLAECAAGTAERARSALTRAVELAQSMGMRLEEARALVALGSLDADPQSPHFHRAREIFAECGSERGLAELREAIAKVRTPAPA